MRQISAFCGKNPQGCFPQMQNSRTDSRAEKTRPPPGIATEESSRMVSDPVCGKKTVFRTPQALPEGYFLIHNHFFGNSSPFPY